ncbi:unnamed protein product [Caenorhabditis bovis]|uniref:PDZ domain-containing protein n=1 Tax=Caenorhabditis bovis TaxID=2654633 RepID=A0A8S1F0R2_9PELO|nr:unnamed protein product [Caenorhabditis bovis]
MPLPADAPPPRLCIIEKQDGKTEYGYNLHSEKKRGQFVGIVDPGSAAERGGLVQGDRIFAVNGHSIISENHKKVVERIKQNPNRCEMLVISNEGAQWYADHGIPITLDLPNIIRCGDKSSSRPPINGSPPPNGSWYAPTYPQVRSKFPYLSCVTQPSSMERENEKVLVLRLYSLLVFLLSLIGIVRRRRQKTVETCGVRRIEHEMPASVDAVEMNEASEDRPQPPRPPSPLRPSPRPPPPQRSPSDRQLPANEHRRHGDEDDEETSEATAEEIDEVAVTAVKSNRPLSIQPSLEKKEEEEEEEEERQEEGESSSQLIIAVIVGEEDGLTEVWRRGIPRLSNKSDSVRIKRRIMDHLDAEQQTVMKEFDEVLDEHETTSKAAETPVFVPPPPPVDHTMKPLPRLCHLEKSSPLDEFGFNLHAEKNRGHFIGTVDEGGIGQRAGLETGQRIVGVNGQLVYPNTPHKDVVALIKKSPLSTTLLVASEDVDKWYKENGVEYSFAHAEKPHEPTNNNVKSKDIEAVHEKPSLSPHSIQVNEEREIVTTRTEVKSTTNSYQYQTTNDVYNPYSAAVADDDLINQVFGKVVLPETNVNITNEVVVTSHTEELEHISSSASTVSSHRESAVDVPLSHQYVPSYVPQQPKTHINHHYHDDHHVSTQQPSPLSNGSSHGYAGSSASGGYDDDDIYHLPAKQAREILRAKHRKHHLHDMSLNEKYQLVSNM